MKKIYKYMITIILFVCFFTSNINCEMIKTNKTNSSDLNKYTNISRSIDSNVEINDINFPDPILREYVKRFDSNSNNVLEVNEISAVNRIDISGPVYGDGGITNIKGIEYFENVVVLYMNDNPNLSGTIDVSMLTNIKDLQIIRVPNAERLIVGNNPNMIYINCSFSYFKHQVDLRNCPNLETIAFDYSFQHYWTISELNICPLLIGINTKLKYLYVDNAPLGGGVYASDWIDDDKIPLAKLSSLETLYMSGMRERWGDVNLGWHQDIDYSSLTNLKALSCGGNNLTKLDVTSNRKLEYLDCRSNKLNDIDLTQNTLLKNVIISNNYLSDLDLSNSINLTSFVGDNQTRSSVPVISKNDGTFEADFSKIENASDDFNPDLANASIDNTLGDTFEYKYLVGVGENALTVKANTIYKYEVLFEDKDDNQIGDAQVVDKEGNAIAPYNIPQFSHYHFSGWDKTFDNINEPIIVHGIYDENNKYKLTYLVTGDKPDDYSQLPSESLNYEGDRVLIATPLKSLSDNKDGVKGSWIFNGWKIKDSLIESNEIVMPNENVEVIGTWKFVPNNINHVGVETNDSSNIKLNLTLLIFSCSLIVASKIKKDNLKNSKKD